MTVISVSNLSLAFGTNEILKNISFSLNENDRLGVVGINGSGKTSLFKLILGEYTPESGNVFISKDKSVGILKQNSTVDVADGYTPISYMYSAFPELTEAEERLAELSVMLESGERDPRILNEYEALSGRYAALGGLEYKGRCASILRRMGYDDESMVRPVETLSGGQRTRLALARHLCREPDILLLDEPTNHLDTETLIWLESFLASYKKCILVISHDRYFLDRVTNKTLIIEHKRGRLYSGGYTVSMKKKKEEDRTQEKHYLEQQKEIARQEAYIAQQRQFNRERNIIAAESRLKLLDKMEKIERPKEAPRAIRLKFTEALESGNDVLHVKGLSVGYNGRAVVGGLDFLIRKGERVFVVGPNGCGKSTFIKTLVGALEPIGGKAVVGYNVTVGYYDQENQNLTPENRVVDELWNAYPRLTESEVRGTLASFRFFGDDVFKQVSMLSGGERARLTLAKLILSHMNLLILDEPTNHLDIDSKEALEDALADFEGTIIVVSHDRYFIDKLAGRIIALKPGDGFDGDFFDYAVGSGGGYTEFADYRQKRRENAATVAGAAPEARAEGKDSYLKAKKELADARKQQKRLERLQKEAEVLEAEIDALTNELFGSAATDYLRAAELEEAKTAKEERLLEIYEEIGV